MKQREDIARINTDAQAELTRLCITFNKPDPAPFRKLLQSAGFYTEWKEKYGDEASAKLERYSGPLAKPGAIKKEDERRPRWSTQPRPSRPSCTPSATAFWGRIMASVVEVPAALIVLAEILTLGGGAFARYALHAPIPWTDELASILFLWLAMLSAIIALHRSAHMQLTTFIKDLSPARRAWLDALGMWLVVAFLLLLVWPAGST